MTARPELAMVVNRDAFFLSHRLSLARAARAYGMSVVVIAGETGSGARIRHEGFRFIPLPIDRSSINPLTEARTLWSLVRLYRSLRPDLIHHSTVKPVIYGSIAARITGSRAGVINTISGLGYVFTSDQGTARLLRPVIKGLWRIALQHPRSRTIFQNQDDRRDFIRMGLVREESTVLVPGSGVDCSQFRPSAEPDGALVVVLPARMLWDKGIREFVEAARTLRDQGCDARFVLVGAPDKGNREAVAQEQLDEWVRDGIVEWWGHRDDMADVLAKAGVVVLPSYGEGVPKALLEAAAAARPVVTTNVRGCREVVSDGVNGLLVPPRDSAALSTAIGRLLVSSDLRQTLGAAGRILAETRFAEPVISSQTLAVYRELISENTSFTEHART